MGSQINHRKLQLTAKIAELCLYCLIKCRTFECYILFNGHIFHSCKQIAGIVDHNKGWCNIITKPSFDSSFFHRSMCEIHYTQ